MAYTTACKKGYNGKSKRVAWLVRDGTQFKSSRLRNPLSDLSTLTYASDKDLTPVARDFAVKRNPYAHASEFREEMIKQFKNKPEFHWRSCKISEIALTAANVAIQFNDPMQKMVRELFEQPMRTKPAKKPHIAEQIIPKFHLERKQLAAAPGYLEALIEDNDPFIHRDMY